MIKIGYDFRRACTIFRHGDETCHYKDREECLIFPEVIESAIRPSSVSRQERRRIYTHELPYSAETWAIIKDACAEHEEKYDIQKEGHQGCVPNRPRQRD